MLGAVSAVAQLLETAIAIVKRLKLAYERQQELADLFESNLRELKNIQAMIELVEEEDDLQTATVAESLVRLRTTQEKLVAWLKRVEPSRKSPVQQYSHQLVHGSKDHKKLDSIMGELDRIKADLCWAMQAAHVGVTKGVENWVIENNAAIRRIDRRLSRVLGRGKGLNLAKLLKNRSSSGT